MTPRLRSDTSSVNAIGVRETEGTVERSGRDISTTASGASNGGAQVRTPGSIRDAATVRNADSGGRAEGIHATVGEVRSNACHVDRGDTDTGAGEWDTV
ncbi:MAG: hypothetical protein NZT92_01690 [Abditibacteriales bacterium]|nr:hypothetical protein [Abditibacteriales bacterium]MDW8364980.1 hypothetical protein [Abditibacteriales bacterium]